MDGVTCDFMSDISIKFPQIETTDSDTRESIIDYWLEVNPRHFLTLQPIDGAIETINRLSDFYDIYFLTTPARNCEHSYMDKKIWLDKHIFSHGKISDKKLILTHNKGLLKGAYLIDDRIVNGVENFEGEHLHFGEGKRFTNWNSIEEYLVTEEQHLSNTVRQSFI
jgi:5'(3')-deoxyribonucleotidase